MDALARLAAWPNWFSSSWRFGCAGGLVLLGLAGCSPAPEQANAPAWRLTVDTLRLLTDTLSPGNFYVHHAHQDQLYLYERKTHSLEHYDLAGQKLVGRVALAPDGPAGVLPLNSLYIHRPDSIFAFGFPVLYLLDSLGRPCWRANIAELAVPGLPEGTQLSANPDFPLHYQARTQHIYLYARPPGDPAQFAELPFAVRYQVGQRRAEALPARFSDEFRRHRGAFGNYLFPTVSLVGDTLLHHTVGEPEVLVTHLATGQATVHQAPAREGKARMEPLPTPTDEALFVHMIENPQFFRVLPDPWRGLYYRLHWRDLPRTGPNGQPNTFFEKKPYLTVLDRQFRVVEALALPMRTYMPYGYFVSPQGLGLVPSHRDYPRAKEGWLEVHWFRFAPVGE